MQLESVLRICDFLRRSSIEDNHDTDRIIITSLVSLAESLRRINKPKEENCENLVK